MNLYLARDMDGMLHAFPVQPYYDPEFGTWMPDKRFPMADTYRVMPRDWGDVQPGKCVLLEEAKPAVVLDGELLRVLVHLVNKLDYAGYEAVTGRAHATIAKHGKAAT